MTKGVAQDVEAPSPLAACDWERLSTIISLSALVMPSESAGLGLNLLTGRVSLPRRRGVVSLPKPFKGQRLNTIMSTACRPHSGAGKEGGCLVILLKGFDLLGIQ